MVRPSHNTKKMSKNHRYDWSKLCPDLLRSILESLTSKDFHRARTVCTNWYSISTTCLRPLYPWCITFNESHTSTLSIFDPEEDKIQNIQHNGIDFTKSSVLATCSNWLLIVEHSLNFFLLNVFTKEKILLPSMESSILGYTRFRKREEWESFIKHTDIVSSRKVATLWINERTYDYVVAWSSKLHYLFVYKSRDDSWLNLDGVKCVDLAYKGDKLYVLIQGDYIKIYGGDSLKEVVQVSSRVTYVTKLGEFTLSRRLAVTNLGEVLIAARVQRLGGEEGLFRVYKMNPEGSDWGIVDCIGNEMLIFGHGVTIRAPVKEIYNVGIKSDSICFRGIDIWPCSRLLKSGVFDIETSKTTCPKSDVFVSKSFWFVPGYA